MRSTETAAAANLSAWLRPERVVDLSVLVAEDLPCSWPTHLAFQHKTFNWFAEQPDAATPAHHLVEGEYQTKWLLIDEHTGTHFDAPSHFIPPTGSGLPREGSLGEASTDTIEPTRLMGPAAVVDVTHLVDEADQGSSPKVTVKDLEDFEARHGHFEAGDVVLLRADWDRFYQPGEAGQRYARAPLVEGTTPGWPAPTPEAVVHLFERGVICLGTDGASIGAVEDGTPAHVAGLGRGMIYVEQLANLRALPARGSYFIFLGIKVRGGTGGPGRAIAIL